jgi:hypothetical protein
VTHIEEAASSFSFSASSVTIISSEEEEEAVPEEALSALAVLEASYSEATLSLSSCSSSTILSDAAEVSAAVEQLPNSRSISSKLEGGSIVQEDDDDEDELFDPNEDKEESIAVVQVVVVVVEDDEVVKVAARDGIICSLSKVLFVLKKKEKDRAKQKIGRG